jgi:transglutaminase-like putative cysteine protease
MYDIRQFRPTLYVVLILGTTAFCLAAQQAGLWLLGMTAILVNAYLSARSMYKPLPRWAANALTLLVLAWMVYQVRGMRATPLMMIGQFLFLLQLVKLYEQRGNRDYAQMLVLSLLLTVAAAMDASSLLFAVFLVVYIIAALYCCLLFHLKTQTDRIRQAMPVPPELVNPASFRQDQRMLPRSMRRLTGLASVVSILFAVAMFLFFPRDAGPSILGQLQLQSRQALTGFSDRISFQQVARLLQNDEVVAHVAVTRDGRAVDNEMLYLRGTTLDTYIGRQWSRTPQEDESRRMAEGQVTSLAPDATAVYHQRISLEPTHTNALFSLAGPVAFRPAREMAVRASGGDGTLYSAEMVVSPTQYEVWATGSNPPPRLTERMATQLLAVPPASDPSVLAQVAQFTRRPEIIGPEGMDRPLLQPYHPSNRRIAQAIESYLQANYSYSLDLTDVPELRRGGDGSRDPVVGFLTSFKRGHCEYFASGMALMCQSIGIPARVVVGFNCGPEDYSGLGGYYIVRQAHAHAWVEVLTSEGWERFDPTSGRAARLAQSGGFWQSIKKFFDFLEFKWAESVIAYDRRDQENLIAAVDRAINSVASAIGSVIASIKDWLGSGRFWSFFSGALGGLILMLGLGLIAAILAFLWQKIRLRRRAQRIGLKSLPASRQIDLARQLAFYDELTTLLERHRAARPRHLTPMEFAHSLSFLPAQVYASIRRLTAVFYRVRFGGLRLSAAKQRHLENVVDRLAQLLGHSLVVR